MYYGPAGAPAATLLDNVRDAKFNLEKTEADVTTRRSNGWEQAVGVLKKGSVEFDMIWDTEDPLSPISSTAGSTTRPWP